MPKLDSKGNDFLMIGVPFNGPCGKIANVFYLNLDLCFVVIVDLTGFDGTDGTKKSPYGRAQFLI